MIDPGPLKALSDTEEDCESGPPVPVSAGMDGDEFGWYVAIVLGVVIFFIFAIGSLKG